MLAGRGFGRAMVLASMTYESSAVSADYQRKFTLPIVLRWSEYAACPEIRARWVCLYLVRLSGWGEPRRAANV